MFLEHSPPYNRLIGGKLIACLVKTTQILDAFLARYGATRGIISQKTKKAQLVQISTSSALGRSSIYNRLILSSKPVFESIGYTSGWGHFHIPQTLFLLIRQ